MKAFIVVHLSQYGSIYETDGGETVYVTTVLSVTCESVDGAACDINDLFNCDF